VDLASPYPKKLKKLKTKPKRKAGFMDPFRRMLPASQVPSRITSFPKATRGFEPISYREMLVSTLLHATTCMFLHNLLIVLVHISNKIGLQKKDNPLIRLRSVERRTVFYTMDYVLLLMEGPSSLLTEIE
jgi:ribosomal protein L32E